jgi:hypothetical protein
MRERLCMIGQDRKNDVVDSGVGRSNISSRNWTVQILSEQFLY